MSSNIQSSGKFQAKAISVLFILVLLAIPPIVLSPPDLLLDLPQYYTAPKMILDGHGADIYRPEIIKDAQRGFFPGKSANVFYVPPIGLPFLAPVGFLPLGSVRIVWWSLLLACVAASLFVLQKAFNLSQIALVRLAAFVAIFAAEWEIIKHGQLAPFLLLGLSLACLAFMKNKQVLAGLCLSALFLKPHFLVPLSVFLLGARKYKAIFSLVTATLVFLLLAWLMIGSQGFINYWQLMHFSMNNSVWLVPEFGPTIRGQLLRFFPAYDQVILNISLVILSATYALLFYLGHRFRLSSQWVHLWLIVSLPLGTVTSIYCHNYDLLLFVPAVAALIPLGFFTSAPLAARIIVFICGFISLMPVYGRIHYYYLLRGGVWNPFVFALLLFSGVMLYVAMQYKSNQVLDQGG